MKITIKKKAFVNEAYSIIAEFDNKTFEANASISLELIGDSMQHFDNEHLSTTQTIAEAQGILTLSSNYKNAGKIHHLQFMLRYECDWYIEEYCGRLDHKQVVHVFDSAHLKDYTDHSQFFGASSETDEDFFEIGLKRTERKLKSQKAIVIADAAPFNMIALHYNGGEPYLIADVPVTQQLCHRLIGKNNDLKALENKSYTDFDNPKQMEQSYKNEILDPNKPAGSTNEYIREELLEKFNNYLNTECNMPTQLEVMLPTKTEWEYAVYGRVSLTAESRRQKVKEMKNARQIRLCVAEDMEGRIKHHREIGHGLSSIRKMKPNEQGLYDTLGLVKEFVLDDSGYDDFEEESKSYVMGASFRTNTIRQNKNGDNVVAKSDSIEDLYSGTPIDVTKRKPSTQLGIRICIKFVD